MDTNKNGDLVAVVYDPRTQEDRRSQSAAAADSSLPNSAKVYVAGTLYKDARVPFREITLAPPKTTSGEVEVNEPVRVYDTSGPWGDPDFHGDVTQGLPPLRAQWIHARCGVEE